MEPGPSPGRRHWKLPEGEGEREEEEEEEKKREERGKNTCRYAGWQKVPVTERLLCADDMKCLTRIFPESHTLG